MSRRNGNFWLMNFMGSEKSPEKDYYYTVTLVLSTAPHSVTLGTGKLKLAVTDTHLEKERARF